MPTTNNIVGRIITIKSISLPVTCINPRTQTIAKRTTVIGTHIPHQLLNAMNKNAIIRITERTTNVIVSLCIRPI